MTTEQDIKELEDMAKALKASAPVAASRIQTSVQTSQQFLVQGVQDPEFKFSPYYGRGKNVFVTLRTVVTVENTPIVYCPSINEPQDGSGDVIAKIHFDQYDPTYEYQIRVIAVGTNAGTFSMV